MLSDVNCSREVSSAGERLLYTQQVAGSIPAPPTMTKARIDMGHTGTWTKGGSTWVIRSTFPTYGKLSMATDASAPLLVVFGGIDVGGVHSGVYMWNYMNSVKDRFHIFVARSNTVNGTQAYRALMSTLKAQSLTPSEQILYLFSGGYRPGMDLLPSGGPACSRRSIWSTSGWA